LLQALTFAVRGAGKAAREHAARLELGLAIAKTLPLVLLIVFGIPAIDGSLLVATTVPDAASLGAAALLLLYAYAGFENSAAAAGEFKNPQRDMPFALLTVIGAVTLLDTLIQLVALGTLPDSRGFGPRMLARVHPRFQPPAWAIVMQAVATLRNSSRLAASAPGFASPVAPRRMTDSAAHLADEVLPAQPMRQWALSLPLRFCSPPT
jgi:basic amino acid/polyamine antiporter, APA family